MDAPVPLRACRGAALDDGAARIVRARRTLRGAVRWEPEPPGTAAPSAPVIGCLPVEESLTTWLTSPWASRAKAEKVMPSLLDIQLPFPIEECVVRFLEVRRLAGGPVRALVCAARRPALRACLARYQAAGLDPLALDHEGLALWTQALEECPAVAGLPRVVLGLEPGRAVLAAGVGTRFDLAQATALPDEDPERESALAVWLRRVLQGLLPAGAPAQWLAAGSDAADPARLQAVRAALAKHWPDPLVALDQPEWVLARALAHRAITRGPLRCNLRQDDLAHPAAVAGAARRARASALCVLAAGLALVALGFIGRVVGERRVRLAQERLDALAGALAPGVSIPYGRELAEARKAWEAERPELAPFLEAFAPSLTVRLAEVVRAGAEAGVTFDALTLRRNGLTGSGAAVAGESCDRLAARLTDLGYTVNLERQDAAGEPALRFTLAAQGGGL